MDYPVNESEDRDTSIQCIKNDINELEIRFFNVFVANEFEEYSPSRTLPDISCICTSSFESERL